VTKPDTFDSTHQEILFKLSNGYEVYGNLKSADKPRNENIDVLVNQVYIEALDFEWKVEGWINCDDLELTTSRDGISTDENTIYAEFMKKLREYLSKNFEPRDTEQLESTNEKDWEKIGSQAILKYFKLYSDDTCKFLEGIVAKLGLKGAALKGGQIWKTLDNSDLTKISDSKNGRNINIIQYLKNSMKSRRD
jgi:hypothetical protein